MGLFGCNSECQKRRSARQDRKNNRQTRRADRRENRINRRFDHRADKEDWKRTLAEQGIDPRGSFWSATESWGESASDALSSIYGNPLNSQGTNNTGLGNINPMILIGVALLFLFNRK